MEAKGLEPNDMEGLLPGVNPSLLSGHVATCSYFRPEPHSLLSTITRSETDIHRAAVTMTPSARAAAKLVGLQIFVLAIQSASWELGPFNRLEHENPVLASIADTSFFCPIHGRNIHWEDKGEN